MSQSKTHSHLVEKQFGEQAAAYLSSTVHSQGRDLERLDQLLASHAGARVLDLGCGAGHASFTAAKRVADVVAYDLSEQMLDVVRKAAAEKELNNISTQCGVAESLAAFDSASFDIVISRYSAHHWRDVGLALREVKRVLKPGGKVILMDVVSPGHPLLDIYLQTVEVLRDTSHVRDYSPAEWLRFIHDAGLVVTNVIADKLFLDFSSWVARMRTPETFIEAIRMYQSGVSQDVLRHFDIQPNGSFTSDMMMFVAENSR